MKAARARKTSTDYGDVPEDAEGKARALSAVLKHIHDKHGKGSIMRLGDERMLATETTSTGCLTLDVALGGGYPKGRIIEIYGPESSGKSTVAIHAVAEVQRQGGTAVYIDAEHAFDKMYAENLGVRSNELYLAQPDYGEQALEIADECMRSHAIDLVVIDSVAALVPKAELDGEIGSSQIGSQARMMSLALRRLSSAASKGKCTAIFINQIRYKVGVLYGNPETTSGGNALKYYSSVRLDIRKKESIEVGGKVVGAHTKVKVVKNKTFPPQRVAEFDIIYGEGINALGCVLDGAESAQIIERRGSYYKYKGETLGQGREKALAALTANPELRAEIEQRTREVLKSIPTEVDADSSDFGSDDDADDDVE